MSDELAEEFRRLADNADRKRTAMHEGAIVRTHYRKLLTIAAGIMTLLSAGSIAASLSQLLGKQVFQVFALVMSIGSGVISLLLSTYYADDDSKVFDGASDYLELREEVYYTMGDSSSSDVELRKALLKHQKTYAKLDRLYSRFTSLAGRAYYLSRRPAAGKHRGD